MTTDFHRHKGCVVDVCEGDNDLFQKLVDECGGSDVDVDRRWTRGGGVPDVPRIQKTRLFKLLHAMPKGALLHAHFPAMVDWSLFLSAVLDTPEFEGRICYLRDPEALRRFVTGDAWLKRNPQMQVWNAPSGFTQNTLTILPPSATLLPPGWELLDRDAAVAIAEQMGSSHTWKDLKHNTSLPWSLIKNVEVFPLYFRLLLEEAIADGLQHVELKTNLGNLHVKNTRVGTTVSAVPLFEGRWMSQQDEIDLMLRVYRDPRFDFERRITFRLILGAHRSSSPKAVEARFRTFMQVFRRNRDVVGGVDIFGNEDSGRKNREFLGSLKKLSVDVKRYDGFVFSVHSGETAQVEYPVDDNLLTLTQLAENANIRVGHATSLWKYPKLESGFVREGIHIEVSPLSNVILGYMDRVANHPGLRYYDSGIPISVNSDDPSYFGYAYVSYDWFLIVLGWKLQLQDIVRICLSSVQASSLPRHEKLKLTRAYTSRMRVFVDALRVWGGGGGGSSGGSST